MCERGISQIRKLETEAQRGYVSAQSHRATNVSCYSHPGLTPKFMFLSYHQIDHLGGKGQFFKDEIENILTNLVVI